jgi:hypothetical protein
MSLPVTRDGKDPRSVSGQAHAALPDSGLASFLKREVEGLGSRRAGSGLHCKEINNAYAWRFADRHQHSGVVEQIAVATKRGDDNAIQAR